MGEVGRRKSCWFQAGVIIRLAAVETSLTQLVDFRETVMLLLLNHRKAPQLISSLLNSISGCKWAAWKMFQQAGFSKKVCPSASCNDAILLGK